MDTHWTVLTDRPDMIRRARQCRLAEVVPREAGAALIRLPCDRLGNIAAAALLSRLAGTPVSADDLTRGALALPRPDGPVAAAIERLIGRRLSC